jgi:hypothetical protein
MSLFSQNVVETFSGNAADFVRASIILGQLLPSPHNFLRSLRIGGSTVSQVPRRSLMKALQPEPGAMRGNPVQVVYLTARWLCHPLCEGLSATDREGNYVRNPRLNTDMPK